MNLANLKAKSTWAFCVAAIALNGTATTSAQELQQTESQPPETAEAVPTIPVESIKAQRTEEPESLEPAATRLEEIVVTASKREESPRALAASVTALTGDDMEELGLRDIDDIVAQVPGLNVWDQQNGTTPKRITVRGIAAEQLTASTTGVFLDETPFTDATVGQSTLDMYPFDLYSVEVLKGPVGTLFGGSGLNGAIRYIPQAPAMAVWEGKAFAEVGTTRGGGLSKTYGGVVNAPLASDELALRLVGIDRHSAGFMDSVHPAYMKKNLGVTDQQAQRAMLRWTPLSRLAVSLMFANQETKTDDVLRITEKCCNSLERTATPRPSPKEDEYKIYNLKSTWSFDTADLVINVAQLDKSGFVEADSSYLLTTNSPPPTLVLPQSYDGTSGVQELRLVSTDRSGSWDWLLGVFNYRYDVNVDTGLELSNGTLRTVLAPLAPIVNAIPVLSGILLDEAGDVRVIKVDGEFEITEQAIFGETNFRFADGWQATAGLRAYRFGYDNFVQTKGATCVTVDIGCPLTGLVATSNPVAREQGLNPKLGLKWQVTPDVMSYATLAKGFRFGGVNLITVGGLPPAFRSDSLWNLEAGIRTEWFEGSLITDVTAFGIRWSDAQVNLQNATGTAGYVDNVGQVHGWGLEGQLIWMTPLPGLRLTVVPAFVDIRTAVSFKAGNREVPSGTQWPLSPRLQTSTSLGWSGAITDALNLSLGLTHRYSSKAPQSIDNPREVFGFSTLNFELGLESFTEGWWPKLSLNVNNLTDHRGQIRAIENEGGSVLTASNEPRSATLRLTFAFH